MPLNLTLFKAVAPEFSSEDSATLDELFKLADPDVNDTVWGVKADHAKALLVAHMLKIGKVRQGEGGPLKRQKVGQLEREFAVSNDNISSLKSTGYGLDYLRIRKQITAATFVEC